jgi:glycosyltransferase involved in cell wall biosynthesis
VRVLHVCSDTNLGGAGQYLRTLLTSPVIPGRYEVAVACPEGALAAALRQAGITVFLFSAADVSFSFAAVRELYQIIRRWRPRIVHTHGSLAGRVAGALGGAKVVYTKHGLAAAEEQAVQLRGAGAFLKRLSTRLFADRIVAVSEAVARALVAQGADPQRVRVIPGGIDPTPYRNLPAPVTGVLGALGRLSYEKGFDILLRALDDLPGTPLLLGGDGPQAERLRQLAGGRPVTMLGRVADPAAFMGQIGIFVLPSRSEGLGLVLIEAMMAGRPVVATNVGGIPEVVVDGETGLLVPPEAPKALAAACARLLSDPAEAARMGEAGRRRAVQLYHADRMAAQTVALYDELV